MLSKSVDMATFKKRVNRACDFLRDGGRIVKAGEDSYLVYSLQSGKVYKVNPLDEYCSCPYWMFRGGKCYHLLAVELWRRRGGEE